MFLQKEILEMQILAENAMHQPCMPVVSVLKLRRAEENDTVGFNELYD
jgi:hypothetical protein